MLAAARALCGREAGIACILGTGSNSCLYDGRQIISNTRGYGYILGDYGSGAVLGRRMLSEWLYERMPPLLRMQMTDACQLTESSVLDQVYRSEYPSRFLASVTPFAHQHRDNPYFRKMLDQHFAEFLEWMVVPYGKPSLPFHCVGSVGYHFQDIIRSAAEERGLPVGRFIQDPSEGLIAFHSHNPSEPER